MCNFSRKLLFIYYIIVAFSLSLHSFIEIFCYKDNKYRIVNSSIYSVRTKQDCLEVTIQHPSRLKNLGLVSFVTVRSMLLLKLLSVSRL